ncbi:MAG: hypothetical protein AAGI03_16315 [Pseudomonadota bacterium]
MQLMHSPLTPGIKRILLFCGVALAHGLGLGAVLQITIDGAPTPHEAIDVEVVADLAPPTPIAPKPDPEDALLPEEPPRPRLDSSREQQRPETQPLPRQDAPTTLPEARTSTVTTQAPVPRETSTGGIEAGLNGISTGRLSTEGVETARAARGTRDALRRVACLRLGAKPDHPCPPTDPITEQAAIDALRAMPPLTERRILAATSQGASTHPLARPSRPELSGREATTSSMLHLRPDADLFSDGLRPGLYDLEKLRLGERPPWQDEIERTKTD